MPFDRTDKKRIGNRVMDLVRSILPSAQMGGIIPVPGKYPCDAFQVGFFANLPFPPGVSDEYHSLGNVAQGVVCLPLPGKTDNETSEKVRPYIAAIDDQLKVILTGYTWKYWQCDDNPAQFQLAVDFPPVDDRPSEYYRAMTPLERNDFYSKYGRQPLFSDEKWVCTRYAGINIFRSCVVGEEILIDRKEVHA